MNFATACEKMIAGFAVSRKAWTEIKFIRRELIEPGSSRFIDQDGKEWTPKPGDISLGVQSGKRGKKETDDWKVLTCFECGSEVSGLYEGFCSQECMEEFEIGQALED